MREIEGKGNLNLGRLIGPQVKEKIFSVSNGPICLLPFLWLILVKADASIKCSSAFPTILIKI